MSTRFNQRCLDVLHSKSVKEFSRNLADAVQSLGMTTIGVSVITEHAPGMTEFRTLTNAPEGYVSDFENLELAKLDPVSQHCKHSSEPIVWDQKFYTSRGRADFWETQASFGLKSGISVAFHLPHGRHFLFGADCGERTCGTPQRLRVLISDLSILAAYAQGAAFDLCLPYIGASNGATLAATELDALRWSTDGLTNYQVGQKMGISATEALLRVSRAMSKLDCASKYEAGLKAIRLGLITCD
jgi:DNA-binding CsgD family transcriptional regulator